jgi:tRNA nucleotidyltransferase (CCA-adding enzyme)
LRLLRAARFAAQLHFDIESDTLQAMTVTAPLLDRIAVERVREELNKLIDSATPERGCDIVVDTRLLGCFPLLDRLFETARPHVWRLVHLGTLSQKWALLCYAAAFSKEQARAVCQLLRMSKRETEEISRFVELMAELSPQWDQPHPIDWSRNLLHYGWSVCMEVDNLLQACWWKNRDRQSSVSLIAVYEAMPVKTVKELAVNGKDLQIALQKKAGEWIQHVLMYLLEQTALHQLPNTPEALVEAARKEVVRYEHQARNT